MKTFNTFKIVFKKELKDSFRDTKSIILNFVLPLLLVPIMFLIMSFSMLGIIEDVSNVKIGMVTYEGELKAGNITPLNEGEDFEYFKTDILVSFKDLDNIENKITINTYKTTEEVKQAFLKGEIGAIIAIKPGVKKLVESNGKAEIKIITDEYSRNSQINASIITSMIERFNAKIYDQRLSDKGIDKDTLVATTFGDVKGNEFFGIEKQASSNVFLEMIIPMLVLMFVCAGGVAMAIDQVAGEKERNTFEPLLSTSGSRIGIILAKICILLLFSLLSVVMELIAVLIAIPFMGEMFSGSMNISIGGVLMCFVNILLFAILYNSVLLMLSVTSKNSKEANMKCGFIMFLPMIIAFTTMYTTGNNVSIATMFIPILNVVNMIKMLLCGNLNYLFFSLGIVSNIIFAVIALVITTKTFSKENLIIRD